MHKLHKVIADKTNVNIMLRVQPINLYRQYKLEVIYSWILEDDS